MNHKKTYKPPYDCGLNLVHLKDLSQAKPFLSFAGYPNITPTPYADAVAAHKNNPSKTPLAVLETELRTLGEISAEFSVLKEIAIYDERTVFVLTTLPRSILERTWPLFYTVSSISTVRNPVVRVEKHQGAFTGSFPLV